MSEFRNRRQTDEGMTLIELVVVISLIGLITTVIGAAIVVSLREAPRANARVESARWEQNLGTWLPADLTSAEIPPEFLLSDDVPPVASPNPAYYDPTDPDVTPAGCSASVCEEVPGEPDAWVNVLNLRWVEGAEQIEVSYRYGPSSDDDGMTLVRVECRNGGCSSMTLVRGMADVGGLPPVTVTAPAEIAFIDENGSPAVNTSGRSVTVLVPGLDGLGSFTFSGGGTELVALEPAAIQPPQFLLARSGCGGPITLIVDESASLSDAAIENVKAGIKSFVRAFAGTPTQLQIIAFAHDARVLGATGGAWNHWYDLSEQSVVNLLLANGSSNPINGIDQRSATNWEDALYHAFYAENGRTYQYNGNPAAPASELVVFFTDGLPTYDRLDDRWGPTTPAASNPANDTAYDGVYSGGNNTQFSPRGWYRAQWILAQNANIDVIGVGVGSAFTQSTDLYDDTDLSTASIDQWAATRQGPSSDRYKLIPAELLLGDLIHGNQPYTWATGTALTTRFSRVAWSSSVTANDGWGDISEADILTTTDFARFGSALDQIALAECGGVLTVQTRLLTGGTPVAALATYEVSGDSVAVTESSTSAVAKTAVFDIATEGAAAEQVLLQPRPLTGSGFAAHSWECRSRNVVVTDPARVARVSASDPMAGLNLTVRANEAMSCVLYVVPA